MIMRNREEFWLRTSMKARRVSWSSTVTMVTYSARKRRIVSSRFSTWEQPMRSFSGRRVPYSTRVAQSTTLRNLRGKCLPRPGQTLRRACQKTHRTQDKRSSSSRSSAPTWSTVNYDEPSAKHSELNKQKDQKMRKHYMYHN